MFLDVYICVYPLQLCTSSQNWLHAVTLWMSLCYYTVWIRMKSFLKITAPCTRSANCLRLQTQLISQIWKDLPFRAEPYVFRTLKMWERRLAVHLNPEVIQFIYHLKQFAVVKQRRLHESKCNIFSLSVNKHELTSLSTSSLLFNNKQFKAKPELMCHLSHFKCQLFSPGQHHTLNFLEANNINIHIVILSVTRERNLRYMFLCILVT